MQSIKRTGSLQSRGEFFICDSHFDESYFERDLKIKYFFLSCFFKFHWWLFEELNISIYFVIASDNNIL